jgi:putative ABC transport system permease protein
MLRTGDVIGQLGDMLGKIALAVRLAAGVTVVAGIVVLVGAILASGQARRYDVVILKLLGGSRGQLLLGQALEYLLLSALLALVAILVGGGGGWYVVTRVLGLAFRPDAAIVALTLGMAILGTSAIGLLGSLAAIRAKPAAALRSD